MKNPFDFENTPLFDTLKKLREISERYESSPTFVALKEFQDKLNTVREPIDGAYASIFLMRRKMKIRAIFCHTFRKSRKM